MPRTLKSKRVKNNRDQARSISAKDVSNDDRIIGQNIRYYRRAAEMDDGRNMTQSALGNLTGLTFQQIQKYESGINRISAGRLAHIATCLDISITDLYRGTSIDPSNGKSAPPNKSSSEKRSVIDRAKKDLHNIENDSVLFSICELISVHAKQ